MKSKVPSYLAICDQERGDSQAVRASLSRFVAHFKGKKRVVDLGCGRGEFLECLKAAGVGALGVEQDAHLVKYCRTRGLKVESGNVLGFLKNSRPKSADGFFLSHVIEHFTPAQASEIFGNMGRILPSSGIAVLV
ncbi:MAG TPA: methionine biosynthesis protein MetW, partial [bacterium]